MGKHEYKVLHGNPTGTWLMPWGSQKVRDAIGPGSFEKRLNQLADEGWEVISCNSASVGSFLWMGVVATVLLRREKK